MKLLKNKFVRINILSIVGLVLVSFLIQSGACNGPIDLIFGFRDKTGCDWGLNILGFPKGQTKVLGGITLAFALVFGLFFYFAFG